MRAHINFEDQPDGAVALQLIFDSSTTPFNPGSHAHQMALCALKYLDALLEKKGTPMVEVQERGEESVIVEPEPEKRIITPLYHLSGSG